MMWENLLRRIILLSLLLQSHDPRSTAAAAAVRHPGSIHEGWGNVVYSKVSHHETPSSNYHSTSTIAPTPHPTSSTSFTQTPPPHIIKPPVIIWAKKKPTSTASAIIPTPTPPESPNFHAPSNAILDDPINDPIEALHGALKGSKKSYSHKSIMQYGNYRATVAYSTPLSRFRDSRPAPPPPPPPKSTKHKDKGDKNKVKPGKKEKEKEKGKNTRRDTRSLILIYSDEKEEENLALAWRLARMAVEDIVARVRAGETGYYIPPPPQPPAPLNGTITNTTTTTITTTTTMYETDNDIKLRSRDLQETTNRRRWEKKVTMVIASTAGSGSGNGEGSETIAVGEACVEEWPAA